MVTSHILNFGHQLSNCSNMVEKSDKKKKEAPSTEVQGDVEIGDVTPEKVCYIQALLYNTRFNYWFSSSL